MRETYLLPVAAVAIFILRYLDLNYAPFIQDEPYLQVMLDKFIQEGSFPLLGLEGTYGLRYGPAAYWFYYPLRLLSSNVSWIIAFHATFAGLGFLLFYLAVKRELEKSAAGWAILLAVSSPFLFFYSRIAWDNTFLIFAVSFVMYALGAVKQKPSLWNCGVLGIGGGLAFTIHAMALPVLAAATLVVVPSITRTANRKSFFVVTLLGFLIPASWYLYGLYVSPLELKELVEERRGFLSLISQILLGAGQFLSVSGFEYIAGGTAVEQSPQTGYLLALFSTFDPGWLLKLLAAIAFVLGLWRARYHTLPPLFCFAYLSALGTGLFYLLLQPRMLHPHYFMAIWWLIFLFSAQAIELASARWKPMVKVLASLVIATNLFFVVAFHGSIRERMGTRQAQYGTAQSELENTARKICLRMSAEGANVAELHLRAAPGIRAASLFYFSQHVEECQRKKFVFVTGVSGAVRYRIVYENSVPGDARLRIEPVL